MNWLKIIALAVGSSSVLTAFLGLRNPEPSKQFLRNLPRNQVVGRIFMAINVLWVSWLLWGMDLSMFNLNPYKNWVIGLCILSYFFIITVVNNYLGARALSLFMLLLAKPILDVCFVRDGAPVLVITTLAYLWLTASILFFAVPHWFRDWINIWTLSPARWNLGCRIKLVTGSALCILGLLVY